MKKTLLGIALCTGMAGVAYADPIPYIGAQAGYSFADLPDIPIVSVATVKPKDDNGFVGEINGGILFPVSDYFLLGPEVGIGFFGYSPKYSESITSQPFPGRSISGSLKFENDYYIPIVARAQFPISDDFYLFAKAGIAYVSGKAKASGSIAISNFGSTSIQREKDQDAWKFTGSVGAGFNLTEQFSLEAVYTYIDGDSSLGDLENDIDSGDVVVKTNNIFVGVNYKF